LRFELLSVKAIKIATLHAAKLHSYWKLVYDFMNTSPILSLCSAPSRKKIAIGKPTYHWCWVWGLVGIREREKVDP
jgi:hypothetical protein